MTPTPAATDGAATAAGGGAMHPRHVAIIMDGNGRWAAKRGLPRVAGHRAGAEAVRRAMSALGVRETQMEAVSLGEERPRATGADEASWAENRRADLVYQ